MTGWLEVSLTVEAELGEAVADVLARAAPHGVVLESVRLDSPASAAPASRIVVVRAYLPEGAELESRRRRLEEDLWHLGQIRPLPEPSYRSVPDTDWTEIWKASYGPTMIGERLQIVPVWADPPSESRSTVWIDPGMAFGTGTHPTTRLCLEVIEESLRPGQTVADLGCGSGILSFAAAKLGARRVLACDTDAQAVAASVEGAGRNGVADVVEVFQGSLEELRTRTEAKGEPVDLLLANLLSAILLDLLPCGLGDIVRPGGRLVLSGILAEQADEVIAAAQREKLQLIDSREEGDWRALVLEVPESAAV